MQQHTATDRSKGAPHRQRNRRSRHILRDECRKFTNDVNRVILAARCPRALNALYYIAHQVDMETSLIEIEWAGHEFLADGVITPEEARELLYGEVAA